MTEFTLYENVMKNIEDNQKKSREKREKENSVRNCENDENDENNECKNDKKSEKRTSARVSRKPVEKKCSHENIVSEKGLNVCVECGLEIEQKAVHNKEWRYYGQSDTKHIIDPNRVHLRKTEQRNIYKDVENFGISETIVNLANRIYLEATKGHIYRGASRKSRIFACVFNAYKKLQMPLSYDKLIKIFGLTKGDALKGIKEINLKMPKESVTYITPANLIEEVMDQFAATPKQKAEVIKLYDEIRNKSSKLNRARPQSVAAGIVYYWIRLKEKDISITDFVQKVSLSEMTVLKISREIAELRETPDII